MLTHAMLLAAGRGSRLRPLTDHTPKPLIEVGGKPLVVRQIEMLAAAGVRNIVINVAHLGQQILDYLGTGVRYGVQISYSVEGQHADDALESLGGILKADAQGFLPDNAFIIASSDIVTEFDYSSLQAVARAIDANAVDAHLVMVDNPTYHPKGDFGIVDHFIDATTTQKLTYANIGVFSPRLFRPAPFKVGQSARLFPWLNTYMAQRRVSASHFDGAWFNVGDAEQLEEAEQCVRSVFA